MSRLNCCEPRNLLRTSAIADVMAPCAAGYSGWFGVAKSGLHPNCSSVAALSSSYPGTGPKPSAVTAVFSHFAGEAVVLSYYVRRPELCDRGLLSGSHTGGHLAERLDLVEAFDPLAALKRRRRIGEKLSSVLQDERPHVPYPRSLRRRERSRSPAPHARARRQCQERGSHADRRQASIAGAQIDDIRRRRQTDSLSGSFCRAVRNHRERLSVKRAQRRSLRRKVVDERPVCSLDHRGVRGRSGCGRDARGVRLVPTFD